MISSHFPDMIPIAALLRKRYEVVRIVISETASRPRVSESTAVRPLRVAFFSDAFYEANGVATLTREFAAFAEREQLPFLCVHSGERTAVTQQGSVTTIELKRSPASFSVDYELRCDLLLSRYKSWVTEQLRSFRADVVHITGPGDFGVLGFWAAHSLRIPLVASWHTNLHEYAGRRLDKVCSRLPTGWRMTIARKGEEASLDALTRFYRLPRFLMAPNTEMVDLLRARTGKPAYFMRHGVDTNAFRPAARKPRREEFCIGYVGRLTAEKNVRMFAELEENLRAAGKTKFRLLLVGAGSEEDWLKNNLRSVELPGILRGAELAGAFASMDAFVFPSQTDTFGLVLLEAMASGVPVIVSPETGARVGVKHRVTGFLSPDVRSIAQDVLELAENEALRRQMSAEARRFACAESWSGVFEQVYATYETGLEKCGSLTYDSRATSVR
jgi:phosphatidylinositol alpha 1,6-mannosyltransferase